MLHRDIYIIFFCLDDINRVRDTIFIQEISNKADGSGDGFKTLSKRESKNPNHQDQGANHVEYSLKKRKNWQLQKQLEGIFDKTDYKIEILETLPYYEPRHRRTEMCISSVKDSEGRSEQNHSL